MLIYLADLTHIGHGVATEAFPLNIGLIASYTHKLFGADVQLHLFKYPQDLISAIRRKPPDILGLSNYTWNSNLSYFVTGMTKTFSPQTLVVWGGTNYPFDESSQEKFLCKRPFLDMHVYYEGEQAFAGLVSRVMSKGFGKVFEQPLAGIQFVNKASGEFVSGGIFPRLRELDQIPSPYATGLLDQFFDGKLTPLIETTRGCPFRCNFCNAGEKYFNKINMFSDEYVKEELTYIAKKANRLGVGHVTMADNNFGMFSRDSKTAELFYELEKKYGWPKSVTAWTGKNSKERVIDVTRLMGETLSISMSVQSMDPVVLKNVERGNVKIEHYRAISEELYRQGRPQHTEVIMPLPGETFESHVNGLNELLDLKVSRVFSHTLQMLHGTPYKDHPEYVRTRGYKSKWRLVPLDFSDIEGKRIFDTEEVAVETSTFGFAEYVEARKYVFIIDLCFNSGLFDPLKKYLRYHGIRMSDWIARIYKDMNHVNAPVREIYDAFSNETQSELWDTEESLVEYYSQPENYRRLIAGDIGGNVLFKHRIWMLSAAGPEWIRWGFEAALCIMHERHGEIEPEVVESELGNIEQFVLLSIKDSFSPEGVRNNTKGHFTYDILTWVSSEDSFDIGTFHVEQPVEMTFSFSSRVLAVALDGFKRYGTDLSGLVKLVQRSYFTFTRKASYTDAALHAEAGLKEAVDEAPTTGPGLSAM